MGNHKEHCVPKESVKAAELEECNVNAVAHITLNPQENTWPEERHHFDASQATRGALYCDARGICKPQITRKASLLRHFF